MDDLTIIDLYFARDENAIKETAAKYGKCCFSIAMNILGNSQDSEECVNDTYLCLWDKIPPTRPKDFSAFLTKITRYISLNRLNYILALKRTPYATVSTSVLEGVLSDNRSVSDMKKLELIELINNFLRNEKVAARVVFIRKYFFFDSINEIAVRYSFSENKVRNMLHSTRNRLKKYLSKEGIEV